MLKAVIKRSGNYFTTITEWDDTTAYYKIAYAKDTKVKYLIIVSGYKFGITPLYNADGTLQVYEEQIKSVFYLKINTIYSILMLMECNI